MEGIPQLWEFLVTTHPNETCHHHPFLTSYHHHPYTMDTLLSQLKGQGSPFSSPLPTSNVDKLLNTIHLLSQATVFVAQQLQEQKSPVKAKLTTEARPPTSLPTPKPSPPPTAKKVPLPTSMAPILSWVPREPSYYSPPSKPIVKKTLTESVSSSIPTTTPTNPLTKKHRKPKSKQNEPNPTSQPVPTTPLPLPNTPKTPPTPLPTPSTALIEKPAELLPTPSPTPSVASLSLEERCALTKVRRKKRIAARANANPTPTTPMPSTPKPLPTTLPTPSTTQIEKPAATELIDSYIPAHSTIPPLPDQMAETHLNVSSIQQITDRWQAICDKAWAAYHKDRLSTTSPYTPDPLHPEYPVRPSQPRPQSFMDPNRDPYQLPLTGSGVRVDGKWYPVPSSSSPSPPGTPVDPYIRDAILYARPPEDSPHLCT